MRLSLSAKALFALLVILGLSAYLVVVDLGINAGRIHYGVSVGDVDVGGLTVDEAARTLDERAQELADEPAYFEVGGLTKILIPENVGWHPRSFTNARDAFEVGRAGGPFTALKDRIDAWTEGVKIPWRSGQDHKEVGLLIDRWEEEAAELGYDIRRRALRRRISRAAVTWPRRTFGIPLQPA